MKRRVAWTWAAVMAFDLASCNRVILRLKLFATIRGIGAPIQLTQPGLHLLSLQRLPASLQQTRKRLGLIQQQLTGAGCPEDFLLGVCAPPPPPPAGPRWLPWPDGERLWVGQRGSRTGRACSHPVWGFSFNPRQGGLKQFAAGWRKYPRHRRRLCRPSTSSPLVHLRRAATG